MSIVVDFLQTNAEEGKKDRRMILGFYFILEYCLVGF